MYLYPDSVLNSAGDIENIVEISIKETEVNSSYKYKSPLSIIMPLGKVHIGVSCQ